MIKRLKNRLKALHDDTGGAMSVEKILIIALIAVPILIVLLFFRKKFVGWFTDEANTLETDRNTP